MNNKNFILIAFIMLFEISFSQNIYSALQHDKGFDLRENSKVIQVTTDIIFYNKSGQEIKKNITTLNSKNKILSELRYDNENNLTDRLTWVYDSTNTKSIANKFERWHKLIGYTCELTSYEYDSKGFLTTVITKNQFKKLLRETTLINNEKGLPIELTLKTDSNIDFGIEIAEYEFEKNIVFTKVLDKNGKTISKSQYKIDNSIISGSEIVNEQGHIIKSENYVFEYKYDKNNNWVKQKRYKIEFGKKILNAEFKRKIKYL